MQMDTYEEPPIVVLIGFLDTKLAEHAFMRDLLESAGCSVRLIDTSIQMSEEHSIPVEHNAEEVCSAASTTLDSIRSLPRFDALKIMAKGALSITLSYQDQGLLRGVIGVGGSTSTALVSEIMRALKIGLPKLIVSTMASGDVSGYVGDSDITIMPSIVDISGKLNDISTRILRNASAAMAGMVISYRANVSDNSSSSSLQDSPSRVPPKRIAITMFGLTTPAVHSAMARLATYTDQETGAPLYEPIIFHATGSGGRSMERLIDEGWFAGVLDLTTTELADNLAGGILSAGPTRLTAAGIAGIPQVVSLGALDMVNFGPPSTIPTQYNYVESTSASKERGLRERRVFYEHNANITLMRTSVAQCRALGAEIARKLAAAPTKTALVIPSGGWSGIDCEGGVFKDEEADAALVKEVFKNLEGTSVLAEIVHGNINDGNVGARMVDILHSFFEDEG